MLEFESDSADPPFTYAEFEKAIAATEKSQKSGLTDEQKRLRHQAARIERVSERMIKAKEIVRFDPALVPESHPRFVSPRSRRPTPVDDRSSWVSRGSRRRWLGCRKRGGRHSS